MAEKCTCKNCEKSFDASFEYCPYCGQEAADKLTFGVLFSNTIGNYFAVDARFFKSFIPLMTKPGVLARRFVDGKRLLYLHPAQFYLFISIVFFFVFSFSIRKADDTLNKTFAEKFNSTTVMDSLAFKRDSVGIEFAKKTIANNKVLANIPGSKVDEIDAIMSAKQKEGPSMLFPIKRKKLDSLIAIGATQEEKLKSMGWKEDDNVIREKLYVQILKFYEKKAGGILQTLYDTIPITMFLMLPLFAFILKLFYWKKGTFAHHMVFSFYFFTFIFTSLCILIFANMIVEIPIWLKVLFFLSFMVYLIIALKNFYKSSWIATFFKAVFATYIYVMIIVPFAITGVMAVTFFLY